MSLLRAGADLHYPGFYPAEKYCASLLHSLCGARSEGWQNNKMISLSQTARLPETLLQVIQRLLSLWLES